MSEQKNNVGPVWVISEQIDCRLRRGSLLSRNEPLEGGEDQQGGTYGNAQSRENHQTKRRKDKEPGERSTEIVGVRNILSIGSQSAERRISSI